MVTNPYSIPSFDSSDSTLCILRIQFNSSNRDNPFSFSSSVISLRTKTVQKATMSQRIAVILGAGPGAGAGIALVKLIAVTNSGLTCRYIPLRTLPTSGEHSPRPTTSLSFPETQLPFPKPNPLCHLRLTPTLSLPTPRILPRSLQRGKLSNPTGLKERSMLPSSMHLGAGSLREAS